MEKNHTHNGTDAPRLQFSEAIENAPQEAVDAITGTASGTYGATEQTLINNLKTTVNELLTKLENIGIIK